MKTDKILDYIFIAIAGIVWLLWVVELWKLLLPYYSYPVVLILFIPFALYYFWKKQWISWRDILILIQGMNNKRRISAKLPEQTFEKISSIKRSIDRIKAVLPTIVYSGVIVVFVTLYTSLFVDLWNTFAIVVIIFFVIYFIAKLLGFSPLLQIQKVSMRRTNALRFFLIIFALFVIALSHLLSEFWIGGDQKRDLIIFSSAIYIIVGGLLFFHISIPKVKVFTLYNLLSVLLISSLVLLLVYQNFQKNGGENDGIDSDTNKLAIVDNGNDEEPDNIEAIISDEANITPISGALEPRLVSQVYAIESGLSVWSEWGDVINLQQTLEQLSYYTGAIDWVFDEDTRLALRNTLMGECEWPESTRWIFGPQAKQCIDNLEILIPVSN